MSKRREFRLKCSFCNGDESERKKIFCGSRVYICDECLTLFFSVFQDEMNVEFSGSCVEDEGLYMNQLRFETEYVKKGIFTIFQKGYVIFLPSENRDDCFSIEIHMPETQGVMSSGDIKRTDIPEWVLEDGGEPGTFILAEHMGFEESIPGFERGEYIYFTNLNTSVSITLVSTISDSCMTATIAKEERLKQWLFDNKQMELQI
ncbi:ClpX C4-type zinc finger protein [Candidatus Peregrinibacteria bacterium]|nr:ClpX C4-type zinc finger protein [Candidatus Peregrinibacteria bacterium]